MTDKEALFLYRLTQTEKTLSEAKKMLQEQFSPRSIINRAYYSMFYAVLTVIMKSDINLKTSKHAGIISLFDKEIIHTGKMAAQYSKMLHKAFDTRQKSDYKDFAEPTLEEAVKFVKLAEEFVKEIKRITEIK